MKRFKTEIKRDIFSKLFYCYFDWCIISINRVFVITKDVLLEYYQGTADYLYLDNMLSP